MKRRVKKSATEPATGNAVASAIVDDDTALFRNAVRDVAPLPKSDKTPQTGNQPQPIPRQIPHDEQNAPDDSLSDHISLEMEAGDEWSFLRPGVSRQTLRRLRRGHWAIQA